MYVPEGDPNRLVNQGNLAVMVWIHGGDFLSGASDHYISDTFSTYGNVIIVTINYRLSLWGFLSTGDEQAPGNYGLWDQHLALKWVHNHIEDFGGDAAKVTIFGQGSGSASVVYQTLFSGNTALFQRAIASSGSVSAPWTFSENIRKETEHLGKKVNCKAVDSAALVECIRNKSPDALKAALDNPAGELFRFIATADGEIVKGPPRYLLNDNSRLSTADLEFMATLDFMSGVNKEEGLIMMKNFLGLENSEHLNTNLSLIEEGLLSSVLSNELGMAIPEVAKRIVLNVYKNLSVPESVVNRRHQLVKLYSDIFYTIPLIDTINLHHSIANPTKNTYAYLFDGLPQGSVSTAPSWPSKGNHDEELRYLFFRESGVDEKQKSLDWNIVNSKYLQTMWSNFAKTG